MVVAASTGAQATMQMPQFVARLLASSFVQRKIMPVYRYMWPPSRRTYAGYLLFVATCYIGLYFSHLRHVRTAEAIAEDARRRIQVKISLENLVRFEDYRAEMLKVADTDLSTDQKLKALKTADAHKLYSMLYDDVENAPVTSIGVDSKDPGFVRAVTLLRERAASELQTEMDRTKTSQSIQMLVSTASHEETADTSGTYKAHEYRDGKKLKKAVTLAKKVNKYFGQHGVPAALFDEARLVEKELKTKTKAAKARIIALVLPHLPKWIAGTLILMWTETMWGVLYSYKLTLPQQLTAHLDEGTLGRAARKIFNVFFAYFMNFPIDTFGDCLVDDVEGEVRLKLRSAVMATVLAQDREYFDFHQVGELQESLNRDTELIARMAVAQPKLILSHITRIVTNASLLFMVSPILAARALLIPLPICGLIVYLSMLSTKRQNRKVNRANDGAAAATIEKLREVSTVRQFGMERYEVARYCEAATWRMQLERRLKVTSEVALFATIQAFVFARLLNIYWGVGLVLRGQLQADRLLMAVINLENAVASVRMLLTQLPQIFLVVDPLERLALLLETTPKIESAPDSYSLNGGSQKKKGLRPPQFQGKLKFEDVHFAYPTEKQKTVLNGLTFTAEPGQKVALVGSAGCGKSTTIGLVQRFYDTMKGTVLLDGHPLKEYDLHYLRAHIGVVAQDNILFTASIYDNITYGMGQSGLPEATEEMVKAACDAANATEFIEAFPNKYATMVGDSGGIKLSGGQKQRIAIARAIIRSPPILLLDEATSALDSVNEKQVQAALDKMLKMHNGVALVIAHRLTTIKNCDNIVVIDKGKKVEEGTHDELLKIEVRKDSDDEHKLLSGFYNKMWSTQMGAETEHLKLSTASRDEAAQRVIALRRTLKDRQRELEQWQTALQHQKQVGPSGGMTAAKSSQRLSVVDGQS